MSSNWDGIFCALWTPTDENGLLDEHVLEANLAFLKDHRVEGLLPLGSTGEFLHLDPPLRKDLIRKLSKRADAFRLIVNISDIRPAVMKDLAQFAKTLDVAAVSVLPPSFYPIAQEDLVEFFVQAGRAAQLPLFLYNFPERTGTRIDLQTIAAVADRVPVAGVKQSGAEFAYHGPLVELGRKKNFVVLTGADTRLPEAMALGVRGCISGLANAVPELVRDSFAAGQKGLPATESLGARCLAELAVRIPKMSFPLDVAAAMEARGLGVGHPKRLISKTTQVRYWELVDELRGLFRQWKLA